MRLEGKIALITGAAGPVGTATALRFAREGATVVLNDIVSTHLDRVMQEIAEVEGGTAMITLGDVTRAAHVDRMVREALDAFGRIDVLLNQAGDTEDVVFTAASLCAEAILPLMRERRWGRVINASTTASLAASGEAPPEMLEKSIITLTRALAVENARFGVTVNCVAPGPTAAAMPMEVDETMLTRIPMGRMAKPREVAAAHVFLASDEASYITGQVLFVDGGLSVAR
jgi:3-oxoacyl-[acyl-carrier protein] reductase